MLNLADAVALGRVPLDESDDWNDEEIVARLTPIKGIGVWTAEMFLIFALDRPDVLPVGDLGIRARSRPSWIARACPSPRCRRPGRTLAAVSVVAIWYLWREASTPPTRRSSGPRPTNAEGAVVNFDLILKNGWVIDGTGGPAFRADVGVCSTR